MTSFPEQNQELLIPGPDGQLQVLVEYPETTPVGIGIICHPHPLHGGSMTNKVVHTIARAWQFMGMITVRFNFRGIGKSEGIYADAIGEQDDLKAVWNWVEETHTHSKIWLAGFSFGSFVAASVASQRTPDKLLMVAPPVHHFPFSDLPQFQCDALVIQGDADEIVPADEVIEWYNSRSDVALEEMPDTSHFFHGKLVGLRTLIQERF